MLTSTINMVPRWLTCWRKWPKQYEVSYGMRPHSEHRQTPQREPSRTTFTGLRRSDRVHPGTAPRESETRTERRMDAAECKPWPILPHKCGVPGAPLGVHAAD